MRNFLFDCIEGVDLSEDDPPYLFLLKKRLPDGINDTCYVNILQWNGVDWVGETRLDNV